MMHTYINTYTYPIRMFIKVVFPAPEGPIIADSLPDSKYPLMLFSIVFVSEKKKAKKNTFLLC